MKTFEDLLATHPNNVQKRLENELVLVLAVMLAPGESLPEHQQETRMVCALTDYTLTVSHADNSTVNNWQAGDVRWLGAGDPVATANTGTTEARFIVTIIKDATHE
jgi:quercetin dioxygenase-like cupin family protein